MSDHDGILIYEEGFSLWQEEGMYHAGVAGNGNLGIQCGPCSLDEAVAFLKKTYALTDLQQEA